MFSIVGFEIKSMEHDCTGDTLYCIVNKEADKFAESVPIFEEWELAMFKDIVRDIIKSDNGKLSELEAINVSNNSSKRSRTVRQEFVRRLCNSKWLELQDEEYVCVGTRTLLELPQLLQEFECPVCPLCNYHVVQGVHPCSDCGVKVHRQCAKRHIAAARTKKCVSCEADWLDEGEIEWGNAYVQM